MKVTRIQIHVRFSRDYTPLVHSLLEEPFVFRDATRMLLFLRTPKIQR